MDVVVEERMRESELFRPWGSFSEGDLSTAFYLPYTRRHSSNVKGSLVNA